MASSSSSEARGNFGREMKARTKAAQHSLLVHNVSGPRSDSTNRSKRRGQPAEAVAAAAAAQAAVRIAAGAVTRVQLSLPARATSARNQTTGIS